MKNSKISRAFMLSVVLGVALENKDFRSQSGIQIHKPYLKGHNPKQKVTCLCGYSFKMAKHSQSDGCYKCGKTVYKGVQN